MRIMRLVTCSLFVSGCAAPPPSAYTPIAAIPSKKASAHEFRKNYQLGMPQRASVGEVVVSVKDYYITTEDAERVLTPSNSFVAYWTGDLTGAVPLVSGVGGASLPVAAEAVIDGKRYYLIEQPNRVIAGSINGIYVGEDGTVRTDRRRVRSTRENADAPSKSGIDVSLGLRIVPSSTRFTYAESRRTEIEAKGYINYDIVFTGKGGDQLNFVYREYSKDDLARQPFFQNLTYSATEKMIRFRNLRIQINGVNNEGISYTVLDE